LTGEELATRVVHRALHFLPGLPELTDPLDRGSTPALANALDHGSTRALAGRALTATITRRFQIIPYQS
jgi:hypothetical protein